METNKAVELSSLPDFDDIHAKLGAHIGLWASANSDASVTFNVDEYDTRWNVEARSLYKDLRLNVNLYIDYREDFSRNDEFDAVGNLYAIYKLKVDLNWSCYGSSSPDMAIAYTSLIDKLAEFGKGISDEFPSNVKMLLATAEVFAERAAKNAASKNQEAVKECVTLLVKNMRMGGSKSLGRCVTDAHLSDFEGRLIIKGKVYLVIVDRLYIHLTRES